MKKKNVILLIILIIVFLVGIGGYVSFNIYVNNRVEKKIKYYLNKKVENKELVTGKLYDLKDENNNKDIISGKIFIDIDNKLTMVENIKTRYFYCTYINEKVDCNLKNNKTTGINIETNKIFKIGDQVTLNNESWHVIHDSSIYSKYVTLIKDKRVDKDHNNFYYNFSFTKNNDNIAFDTSGAREYNPLSPTNIGYYLENTYKYELSNSISNIYEIRLLGTIEFQNLKDKLSIYGMTNEQRKRVSEIDFKYSDMMMDLDSNLRTSEEFLKRGFKVTKEEEEILNTHWLYNGSSGNYWLKTEQGKKNYTAIWDGTGIINLKPIREYSIKPVITISKDNIK